MAQEEVLDADVLIKVRPVNTFACAYETPVVALRLLPMK
jgi:hypothetical protein